MELIQAIFIVAFEGPAASPGWAPAAFLAAMISFAAVSQVVCWTLAIRRAWHDGAALRRIRARRAADHAAALRRIRANWAAFR